MKYLKLVAMSTLIVSGLASCQNQGVTRVTSLNSAQDSAAYAIGMDIGRSLKSQFSEINVDIVNQALKKYTLGDTTGFLIQEKDTRKVLMDYRTKKREIEMEEKFGKVKEEGIKFLNDNKAKEGVKTTASGLQYMVMKEGNGAKPLVTSKVRVHYHGTTPTGEVFDSSVDKGTPAEFGLNQVIKGWTEGLQLMPVGSKFKFFIPQELAYGANAPQGGNGPIKPFMPLVFEVELLDILDASKGK